MCTPAISEPVFADFDQVIAIVTFFIAVDSAIAAEGGCAIDQTAIGIADDTVGFAVFTDFDSIAIVTFFVLVLIAVAAVKYFTGLLGTIAQTEQFL